MGDAALGSEPSTVKWISACPLATDKLTVCDARNVPAVGVNETVSEPGPEADDDSLEQPTRSAHRLSSRDAAARAFQKLGMRGQSIRAARAMRLGRAGSSVANGKKNVLAAAETAAKSRQCGRGYDAVADRPTASVKMGA
jgi:hypothetical protein